MHFIQKNHLKTNAFSITHSKTHFRHITNNQKHVSHKSTNCVAIGAFIHIGTTAQDINRSPKTHDTN